MSTKKPFQDLSFQSVGFFFKSTASKERKSGKQTKSDSMNAAYLSEEWGKTDFEQTRPKLQKNSLLLKQLRQRKS